MKYRHIVMHNKLYFHRIKRINEVICRIPDLSPRICVTTRFVKHFHISDFFDFVLARLQRNTNQVTNEKGTDDSFNFLGNSLSAEHETVQGLKHGFGILQWELLRYYLGY